MVVEDNFAGQQDLLSQNSFYMNLGKDKVEYLFSSMERAKQVSNLVGIAESLGLKHSQNFVDTLAIRVNSSFYISQDLDGNIYMVGKYSDFTYISSDTIKELVSEGYDLELDGLLILITTNKSETEREQIESLKALGDKYPLGFSRFNSNVTSQ
jgi:hypothetical protein